MRKIVLSMLAASVALAAVPAMAQGLNIKPPSSKEPVTGLEAEQWAELMTGSINPANIIGKDAVYMINATGEPLNTVTCGTYQLVGTDPYLKSEMIAAPATLPAWEVTLVPTRTFNKYCQKGVDGAGRVKTYHGNLNASDKTMGNSTFIIFMKAN